MSGDFLSKDPPIYINSAARVEGSSSRFVINLAQQVSTPNNYDTAVLLTFNCPKSYYLINSTNSTFTLNENGSLYSITLPIGNYTFTSMREQLQQLLSGHAYTYTVTSSTVTGKYTFTASGVSGAQPIFIFADQSPRRIIGFDIGSYSFAGTAPAGTLSSTNLVFMQLTSTIRLCCNFVDGNVFATIVPNTSDFSTITYIEQNPTYASHFLSRNNVQSAEFYLLDAYGNTLDLNGLDYNFTFVLYERNTFFEHSERDRELEIYAKELEARLAILEKKKLSLEETDRAADRTADSTAV